MKKQKKNNKKLIVKILLVICILVFLFSGYKIVKWNIDNKITEDITNDIQNTVHINEVTFNENTTIVNSEKENKESIYWKYIKMNLINVDFNELIQKNNDTKGWIQVNGTNVNYPFVGTNDNSYYLNHSFEKKNTSAGWIFLDYRNNMDNLSKNTIIYGHSRLDLSMFGTLKNTLKKSWYNNKNNHIIKISTPKENTMWQIFSIYVIDTETYYITTDFNSVEAYQNFLDTMVERSKFKFNANVTTDDNILTLSTCYSNTQKLVIHAKLIKKETRN